jgi:hypothetical protein
MWSILLFHIPHTRATRSPAQLALQEPHRMVGTAHHNLHRSVRQIPHEPLQIELVFRSTNRKPTPGPAPHLEA